MKKIPPPIWFLNPVNLKRFSVFIFLLFFLFISNSCRNEDLFLLPEHGDESFFLYEKQDNRMKNYAIDYLKKLNDSARFVPEFRKDYGMPLWDNELFFDHGNSKVLLFPVNKGKTREISALLYFVFCRDGFHFNTLVRGETYAEFGETEPLFYWVEHNVYGRPANAGIKVVLPERNDKLKRLIEVTNCWYIFSSVDGGQSFTYRHSWCTTDFAWLGGKGSNGGGANFGGVSPDWGEGGGGGGGGGGSPAPPVVEPQPLNPILTVNDPCELVALHAQDEALKNVLQNLRKNARRNIFEEGYILTQNPGFLTGGLFNYEYVTSNAFDYIDFQLAPGQIIDGFIHTHHEEIVPMFTAHDIAKIYEWYQSGHIQNLSNFTMILINGRDRTSYSISIHDPALFISFCQSKLNTSQKIDFWNNRIIGWQFLGQQWLQKAFLDVFENAGISLFQGNRRSSTWTRKELNPGGYVVNNNCPN